MSQVEDCQFLLLLMVFCDFLFMFNDKKLNFKFVVIEKFFIKDIYIIYKI